MLSFISVQQKASKVVTVDDDPFGGFFDDFFGGNGGGSKRQVRTQPQVGIGSGVIISQDGYIVTNNHVVEGADEIEVTLNDNRSFKGRIIGTDASTDLALVKITGDNFPTLPVGDSDEAKVGEWVIAVGKILSTCLLPLLLVLSAQKLVSLVHTAR
jgi:S1-C subfamily serine protease